MAGILKDSEDLVAPLFAAWPWHGGWLGHEPHPQPGERLETNLCTCPRNPLSSSASSGIGHSTESRGHRSTCTTWPSQPLPAGMLILQRAIYFSPTGS